MARALPHLSRGTEASHFVRTPKLLNQASSVAVARSEDTLLSNSNREGDGSSRLASSDAARGAIREPAIQRPSSRIKAARDDLESADTARTRKMKKER